MRPLAQAATAAAVAAVVQRLTVRSPLGTPGRWQRANARGVPVSLVSGPALALALTVGTGLPRSAVAAAALGAGACGRYDDVVGDATAKGVRGHLGSLRQGRVTTGAVKVAGIGLSGLAASALLGRRPVLDVLLDGAVVAGAANALNLLDLRPGRALKTGLVAAVLTRQAAPAAAAAALLPADLGERTMLGDTGANALGAVLGLGLVARTPQRRARVKALTVLVGVTAASEVVSFSRVIDAVPPLRALDRAGRVP